MVVCCLFFKSFSFFEAKQAINPCRVLSLPKVNVINTELQSLTFYAKVSRPADRPWDFNKVRDYVVYATIYIFWKGVARLFTLYTMMTMSRLPLPLRIAFFSTILSTLPKSQSLLHSSCSIRHSNGYQHRLFTRTFTRLPMALDRGNRRGSSVGGRGGGRRQRRPRAPPPPIPPIGEPGRGCFRELVVVGAEVFVVKKEHQRTGAETSGTIMRLLTNSPYHPRGIKVMLTSGDVGRVTRLIPNE